MSTETEKFVMQYVVEMKDAISRIEQLDKAVDKTKTNQKSATKEFKEFATGAADELDKVVPGISRVSGAIKLMSVEFAAAGAAVAVLALGVKAFMDTREQLGQQRLAGMDIGVSGLRMEEYQRKFIKNSNGTVDRDQTESQIRSLATKYQSAYTDPTRMNEENRLFQMLGVKVAPRGDKSIPFNTMLSQLGGRLADMNPEQARGIGKAAGLSQDFVTTLQKLGTSVGTVTELTENEVAARKQAEQNLQQFNNEMAHFNEKVNELSISLGQKLIPYFTDLITVINDILALIPGGPKTKAQQAKEAKEAQEPPKPQNATQMFLSDAGRLIGGAYGWAARGAVVGWGYRKYMASRKEEEQNAAIANAPGAGVVYSPYGNTYQGSIQRGQDGQIRQQLRDQAQPQQPQYSMMSPSSDVRPNYSPVSVEDKVKPTEAGSDKISSVVDKMDEQNTQAINNANQMQLAINMFSGSVATFAQAIDQRQAWAAWAGELGRAAQLDGASPLKPEEPKGAPTGLTGANSRTKYDQYFEQASNLTNVPAELLKKVAMQESSMNPNAVSNQGAKGLMQLIDSTAKNLNVKDSFDPQQNIMGGARLLQDLLKRSNGDVRTALMMYHGGLDKKNWGPKTQAYPDQVLRRGPGEYKSDSVGQGESKEKMQLRSIQEAIAGRLGVPLQQLQLGQINRGDVSWASGQLNAGYQNKIYDVQKQLMNAMLPQQDRSKLMTELREQQSGLAMLQHYSGAVEANSQAGDRSITIGERAITININGVNDPTEMSKVIQGTLTDHLGEIVNNAASGKVL